METSYLIKLLKEISDIMAENKDKLIEMDGIVGDGDLGLTMSDGFKAAYDAVSDGAIADAGKLLFAAGKAMANKVPSTMGSLMATGLKQAGKDLKGKETLEDADVVQIFASYEAGVAKLGEAKVGDKTAEYALKVTAKANGTNNKNEKPADGGAVKTGDSNHISGFVVAMLLSIAAIVGVVIFKKRTHR